MALFQVRNYETIDGKGQRQKVYKDDEQSFDGWGINGWMDGLAL